MRIVFVSEGDVPSWRGRSFQAMKLADALAARVAGLEVVTAGTLRPSPPRHVPLASWYGTSRVPRVVALPVRWSVDEPFLEGEPPRRFHGLAAAYAWLRAPDLVYARSAGAALHCVRHGRATVAETDLDPKRSPLGAGLADCAGADALRGLVVANDALAGAYAERGVPAEKLLVAGAAVRPQDFDRAPEPREARRMLGLPLDRPVVVYAGDLDPAKGTEVLVAAARRAPDLHFCLVGGGRRAVNTLRRVGARAANLRLEGLVPNRLLPSYFAAADALALPAAAAAVREPVVLSEYMAARRPIAATSAPAHAARLRHDDNALLVEPDAPRALAAALRRLVDDAALASRLASRARRDVEGHTWELRAREVLERFGDLGGFA